MSDFVAKLEVDRNPVLAMGQLPSPCPKNASLSKQISRFSGTVLGVVPQPAQDSYPPLVWPQSCSDKVPKGLSKNILKKFKRKMWGELPSRSTFAGDEIRQLSWPSISDSENL